MAPGALWRPKSGPGEHLPKPLLTRVVARFNNYLLSRSVKVPPSLVVGGSRNEFELEDGTRIYDASNGAAVSCLGRYDSRVEKAIVEQMRMGVSYIPSLSLYAQVTHDLAKFLVESTNGQMSEVAFYGSGSAASEAALKLARQYHVKQKKSPEPERTLFIARNRSYHGATLGALDLSGHNARKALFEPMLAKNVRLIPPCYPYRDRLKSESNEAYVQRLKQTLVNKIEELGPKNIAGFIVEPVVGAALGCVSAVPGYLAEMRIVCDHYGILLIFDEIMCGMGRTGYLHAWQKWGVVPDVQLIGKGLAAGFAEISGMLIGPKIADAFKRTGDAFVHGHTFQNFPLACAAALATQRIIRSNKLLENVQEKGGALKKKLRRRLGPHRYVGDIRGEGLFLGIEFVKDKQSKAPFDSKCAVADQVHLKGLTKPHNIYTYPGAGTVDGTNGDHIILAPAYNITDEEVDLIVDRVTQLVEDYFDELDASMQTDHRSLGHAGEQGLTTLQSIEIHS